MFMEPGKKLKKYIICVIFVFIFSMVLVGCTQQSQTSPNDEPTDEMKNVSSEDSLKLLEEGNARFVSGGTTTKDISEAKRENLSVEGQFPFAVIVSCSDSRVPPMQIFDQGLGDLFEIRVAGNIMDPVSLGSVEYAAEHLGSPLIVVMGHEKCGAVKATMEGGEAPGSIGSIVEKIKPAVEKVTASGIPEDQVYEKAIDENIKNTIADIEKSPIVEELVASGELKVVGAKYDLDTGKVEILAE
ncbi:MAG: carbonic anhydrase [Acetobacterium sp.]|nr:carbonic anhydrase [Acetobacterium sp.]